MKLVYTAENSLLVGNAQNLLEQAGIAVILKNEQLSSGVGELSAIDTWPELWLENEADYSRALEVISPLMSSEPLPSWSCMQCGEDNEASFENTAGSVKAAKPEVTRPKSGRLKQGKLSLRKGNTDTGLLQGAKYILIYRKFQRI